MSGLFFLEAHAAPFQVLQNTSIAPNFEQGVFDSLDSLRLRPTQLYIQRTDDQLYNQTTDSKMQALTTQTFRQGITLNPTEQPFIFDWALLSKQDARYRYVSDSRTAAWTTFYETQMPSVILGKKALSVFNLDQGERRIYGFNLKVHPTLQVWSGQVQSQITEHALSYQIDDSRFETNLPDVETGQAGGVQIEWGGVRLSQEYFAGERTQRVGLALGDWALNWAKRVQNRSDLSRDVVVNDEAQGEWSGFENYQHQEIRLNYTALKQGDFQVRAGEYKYQAQADMVLNKQALDFPWVSFFVRDAVGQFQGRVKQQYVGVDYQKQWNANWRFRLGLDWVRVETDPYQFDYWLRLFPFGQAGADAEQLDWVSSDWLVLAPSVQYQSKNWMVSYAIRQLIPYRTEDAFVETDDSGGSPESGTSVDSSADSTRSDVLFKRGFLQTVSFVYWF